MSGTVSEHLLQRMATESMSQAMQMRASIFPTAMRNAASEQYLPEIRRHRTYGILSVTPSAHKKVVCIVVNRMHMSGIPEKVFAYRITKWHIPILMVLGIPDVKEFSFKIHIPHPKIESF